MVEPNIKEGKGGLRDLHTLFWIAKFAHRADSIIDIVESVLRVSEARRFARRNASCGRFAPPSSAGRRLEERLDFDAQMAIAPLMVRGAWQHARCRAVHEALSPGA